MRLLRLCATVVVLTGLLALPGAAAAPAPLPCPVVTDPMALWRDGVLRGANLWQGRLASGANQFPGRTVGVPVEQADVDALRALGADYLHLSVAGLFTEQAPYVVDPEVESIIDETVRMAAVAGLHVAIAFRSGPGRNEQALARNADVGTYGPILETIWSDPAAQDGWMRMLAYTAQRYGDDPAVIGLSPMTEPNASSWSGTSAPGPSADVDRLQQRARDAIRAVSDVPILVEGDGYGSVRYLPWLRPTGDDRSVYTAHFYEPHAYTHQEPAAAIGYPGVQEVDGRAVTVDRAWLAAALAPVGRYRAEHAVPVAVTELGVRRFAPGAATYLGDVLSVLDELGASRAVWEWVPDARRSRWNEFDPVGGPDPRQRAVVPNAVRDVLAADFARCPVRR